MILYADIRAMMNLVSKGIQMSEDNIPVLRVWRNFVPAESWGSIIDTSGNNSYVVGTQDSTACISPQL